MSTKTATRMDHVSFSSLLFPSTYHGRCRSNQVSVVWRATVVPSSEKSIFHVRYPNDNDNNPSGTLSSMTTPDSTSENNNNNIPLEEEEFVDVVICGGGPAGLLTAIMLAQRFPDQSIRLYDRLSIPPSADDETVWNDIARFYLIGLGGRGRNALQHFHVWDAVEQRSVAVVGRQDWAPNSKEGVERIFDRRERIPTSVLPRDKLVGILYQHILDNYSKQIEMNFGYEVHPVNFSYQNGKSVLVQLAKCTDENLARQNPSSVKTAREDPNDEVVCDVNTGVSYVATNLLVAADGTVRTVANAMERQDRKDRQRMNPLQRLMAGRPFHVKRYIDDNQRIYKTIPMKLPPTWRSDLNYSARTKDGRISYEALPANNNGDYCGVLLLRKGDPMAAADTDPITLRCLLNEAIPQFSALLDDETVTQVAKKSVSYLPGFRYAGPRLHQGDHCLLLGDCAHTVKPYFGLGANSALEDVKVLDEILDQVNNNIPNAVRIFSSRRAPESRALVRLSRDLDRPGTLGFVTFILPLILDSIFHRIAPKMFSGNVITMLQREDWTFCKVARSKRFDRMIHLGLIGSAFMGMVIGVVRFIRFLSHFIKGRQQILTTAVGLLVTTFMIQSLRAFQRNFLVKGIAPADIVSRLSRRRTQLKNKQPQR